jgi:hypothetical protein
MVQIHNVVCELHVIANGARMTGNASLFAEHSHVAVLRMCVFSWFLPPCFILNSIFKGRVRIGAACSGVSGAKGQEQQVGRFGL